jgi:hypothetical protein
MTISSPENKRGGAERMNIRKILSPKVIIFRDEHMGALGGWVFQFKWLFLKFTYRITDLDLTQTKTFYF